LTNGKVFDSSRQRGQPFRSVIGVGRLIKGWDEGIPTMSLGESAILSIQPEYGYGARGAGASIPPNSELIFEVRIINS
ncbi:peptidyl-prolyl cis-trans isomerase, partial [Neocallimastix californiae]